MQKFHFLMVLFLTLFYSAGSSRADYIYLKDGSIISGILIEEKEKILTYRVVYGEMFINRENIVKIVSEAKASALLREAEKYMKDQNFKRTIKTCEEILGITPHSSEALELKKVAVETWRKQEDDREEKIRREKEERERKALELEKAQTDLKTKWGLAIMKDGRGNYVISDVYYNCPLIKGEIKTGDGVAAIQQTKAAGLSIKKVYDLFLLLNKINLSIQRPVILTREKIIWQGTKEYVGLGISLEKVEGGIKVTNLMPDGPSAKAGVLKDDLIISLDGQDIGSFSMDEVIKIIKGGAGTKLKAVIERALLISAERRADSK